MQREQIKKAFCKTCGKESKFERHVTVMGAGDLVMVILTVGLWLILRHVMIPRYRCHECGGE